MSVFFQRYVNFHSSHGWIILTGTNCTWIPAASSTHMCISPIIYVRWTEWMKMQSKKLSQLNSALFYFKAAAWTVELKINVMEKGKTIKRVKMKMKKNEAKWEKNGFQMKRQSWVNEKNVEKESQPEIKWSKGRQIHSFFFCINL